MTEKQCYNCKYWNNDTGFCEMKMIITSKKEVCDYWSDLNDWK